MYHMIILIPKKNDCLYFLIKDTFFKNLCLFFTLTKYQDEDCLETGKDLYYFFFHQS